MKILIDIPDPIGEYYLTLFSDGKNIELKSADYLERIYGITYQVLPKGHDRLIEVNEDLFQEIRAYCGKDKAFEILENAPTVIEADKETENGNL